MTQGQNDHELIRNLWAEMRDDDHNQGNWLWAEKQLSERLLADKDLHGAEAELQEKRIPVDALIALASLANTGEMGSGIGRPLRPVMAETGEMFAVLLAYGLIKLTPGVKVVHAPVDPIFVSITFRGLKLISAKCKVRFTWAPYEVEEARLAIRAQMRVAAEGRMRSPPAPPAPSPLMRPPRRFDLFRLSRRDA